MISNLRFAAQYTITPDKYERKLNSKGAALKASNLMAELEFRQLGGESLTMNPENGEITLQTNLGVSKPNSSEIHHDGLILQWLGRKLDYSGNITTLRESVNNLLLKANAASQKGPAQPWDEFAKDAPLTYTNNG